MSETLASILGFFLPVAHAAIAGTGRPGAPDKSAQAEEGGSFWEMLEYAGSVIWNVFLVVVAFFLLLKLARLLYEIYKAKNLVYLRVTLPRADSKLDKERETKKDFKEKAGIMAVFYKSIHKIGDITFKDWILDMVFNHMKISLEFVFNEGQLEFYVVTYANAANFVAQQITSNYPDAEVRPVKKSEYPNIKPRGYTIRTTSINKVNDDVYPIKTFKYFEDDPLSTFTNGF